MKFLEARKLVQEFRGGEPLPLLLGLSGLGEPFELYLQAAGALRSRAVQLRMLPFGTLSQHLLGEPAADVSEVLLVLPWDFAPEADWRSGVAPQPDDPVAIGQRLADMGRRLSRRRGATILYLPAPMAPVWLDPDLNAGLAARVEAEALAAGARMLPREAFSLSSYLSNGCPVGGAHLGAVAAEAVAGALAPRPESKKVLVTDFDNVLWGGVLAEDGVDGIAIGPEGRGFRHYIYQSLLLRLKRDGVLLAGVTRNAPDIVAEVFQRGVMPLREQDFVAVLASYGAKSAQIQRLAESLNLGLDAFVFVDDNPVELAEVAMEVPGLMAHPFPDRDEGLPDLCSALSRAFRREVVTAEDRDRTELYRRRLETIAPSELAGADLTGFLRGLEMILTIHDRSRGDRTRVVQLINKTNQFNLNGRRLEDGDVAAVLAAGGRLYGASLADRTGSHGEVLACLLDGEGTMRAFVMSCRVFQRRLENVFLAWLCAQPSPPRRLDFAETARNEPFRIFLRDPAFTTSTDPVELDPSAFAGRHASTLDLFSIESPGTTS